MKKVIDINADMGESFGNFQMGNDAAIMPYVTSANIACGFHAGDPVTMKHTVRLARENNVAVGAHHGFHDLLGFGRRVITITADDLYAETIYQIGALKLMCARGGIALHHVKPHGALYNHLVFQEALAKAYINAIHDVDPTLLLYHLGTVPDSPLVHFAEEKGIRIIREFYADLDFAPNGLTVIKKVHGEVDAEATARRVAAFLETGKLKIGSGDTLAFSADSICVHGDNPSAAKVITVLRGRLKEMGYEIKAPQH
jgi:UPF0271 protein